ncbi:hypothetical protein [Micromonospora sp. NBC_01813]|uniref:hypothetical protein n=1 Tax=Micromonospora sp. NBC_01813 TaxID=2975988 RepID=UPI002DDAB919|nr:hypothetical protein [Micromonospora sp. NBC_01813]WSA09964.1 hypothetical protein OG958_03935 [Micromonospora sp. NBC_01813]
MPRNDGIGGTPRLARYTSIGTPPDSEPTPNRPPLPRRTPGQTDADQDRRFRVSAAPGAAAPTGAHGDAAAAPRSPAAQRALTRALDSLNVHLPSRLGDCRRCDIAAPCKPFLRALVIVQRWDPAKAQRVRAVLHLSGLWSPGQQPGKGDAGA